MFCCWSSIGKNRKSIRSMSKEEEEEVVSDLPEDIDRSMSKEEEEEVVFDLPEDLVVKILYRLPVKSLLRFTCVSKRWHSIISDSKFARSTFEVASKSRTLRPRLLFSTYPYYGSWDPRFGWEPSLFASLGDLDVSSLEEDRLVQSLTPPPGVITEKVMASCNGLIVLGKCWFNTYTNLCVWNPTTGFFRKIPDPEVFVQIGASSIYVTFAFGHVMATDDYKLVFFVPADFTIHIFSTRDGSWKVNRFPHSSFPSFDDGKGLLVSNGAIHWVSTGIPEAISAFDLGSEEFRQIPLPPALIKSILNENGMHADTEDDEDGMDTDNEDNEDDMNRRRIWTQVVVGGRLCVRSRNEYWVMKQYGVPESWVKMFQFSVVDVPNVFASVYGWVPAFVTEGGTVVMLHRKELVRIECLREGKPVCSGLTKIKIGQIKNSSVQDGFKSDGTVYDETLLSV